jgi:pimeloyl-ACP methyl ester carboxylesterase
MLTPRPSPGSPPVPAPLILLHGNYASPRWWEPVRQHLPDAVTALTPDMRRWVENGRTSISHLATSLGGVLQANDIADAVIVGHSLGGVVATQFALDHPDLVRGLVLIATGPPEGVPLGRFAIGRQLPLQWLNRRVLRAALGKAGLPRQHPLAEALVEDALRTDPAIYAAFSRAVARWNVSAQLGELQTPTLLIWGDQDPVMPIKIGWRLRGLIPHSRLVTLPGVGHSPPLEAPASVVDHLLAFLDAQTIGAVQPAVTAEISWPRRLLTGLTGWFRKMPG